MRECRRFLDARRVLDALTNRRTAPDATDVTAGCSKRARAERHRPDSWTSTLRLGLVGVAIAQFALAIPGLFYGTDEGAPIHIAHEVGGVGPRARGRLRLRGVEAASGGRPAAVRGRPVRRA